LPSSRTVPGAKLLQLSRLSGTLALRIGSTAVAMSKQVMSKQVTTAGWRRKGAPARNRSSRKKEQPMKLNSTQVKQTLNQMNAQVLPDNHPAVTQLTNVFGDHTFFLDESGLKVLEPAEAPATGMESGEVLSLADWTDASLTSLTPHEPEPTGTIVVFREATH
jgi:hypothetical protein